MNTASRKIALDQAVLNFIIKDCQPLSIVESEGFRELVQVLEPSYVLPTRKTIKELLAKKHAEELERVKMEVQQAVAIQHYSQRKACSSAAADGTARLETYQRGTNTLEQHISDAVTAT
ncbi:uncharacterized protein LOC106098983 isoform X3 [Oreochromis niloticus]|uniref:uncharacterized protein LOC106098983 isoform X3 n=1 Tax=Oreochromis niloticus TaxID=8128 RepID=UPI000DF1F2B4|nr:uncharacterized protein LOC106098983 isoform X3 [Oreochromis niloticus]